MPDDIIEVAVVDATSYHSSKEDLLEMARRSTDAGVRIWLADQTMNWFPDGLWRPELAPISREWRRNAFWDVYPAASYIAAKVPESRFLFSHDAIRRGPEILAQTMMTIQEFCGDAYFAIGGGEIKQLTPFGYHEARPIGRVRESIKMIKKLWDSDEPFDFEGRTMTLRRAQLGTRAYDGQRPKVMDRNWRIMQPYRDVPIEVPALYVAPGTRPRDGDPGQRALPATVGPRRGQHPAARLPGRHRPGIPTGPAPLTGARAPTPCSRTRRASG